MQDSDLLKRLKPGWFPPLAAFQHLGKCQERIIHKMRPHSADTLGGTPQSNHEKTRMMKTNMRVSFLSCDQFSSRQLSRKLRNLRERLGCFSLRSALASI